MYESPITLINGELQSNLEDKIYTAIRNIGIVVDKYELIVDKEELIKALKYDRGQYEKGYADAKAEQNHGKWIQQDHNKRHGDITTCMYYYPVCSECGHTGDFNMNYCPNCGADMREETQE